MTVERLDTRDFDAVLPRVVSALREVLSEGQSWHRYTEVQETDGGVFEARIRPLFWPLVLSTGITITLHDKGSRTTVALETRSQWYIFGDVFNMYRGYIKDLFSSLKANFKVMPNCRCNGRAAIGVSRLPSLTASAARR